MHFAHKGCGEVVAEFVGEKFYSGMVIKSSDWLILGKRPKYASPMTHFCPKCGQKFGFSSQCLERVEDGRG